MVFFRGFVYFRPLRVLFVVLLIAVVALSSDVGNDGGRAQVAAPKGVVRYGRQGDSSFELMKLIDNNRRK